MCLIVVKGTEKQITKKNLVVYKALHQYSKSNGEIQISAIYSYFVYKFEELYETEICESTDMCGADYLVTDHYEDFRNNKSKYTAYGQGFHSCDNKKRAELHGKVFKCTIPKGSEYICDETGLIVSNKIIIHKPKCKKSVTK